jgi:hypothetical protein
LVLTLTLAVSAVAQSVDWKTKLKKADGKTLRIIMIQDPWVKACDTIDQEFQQLTGLFGTALNNQRGAAVGQAYFEYIFNFGGKAFNSMYPGSPDQYADMTPLLPV